MKKLLVFFILILVLSCGKSDSNSGKWDYYFQGTVYLRETPTSDVLVNMGYRDTGCQIPSEWRTEKEMRTDESGKYEFTMSITNETGFRWRCKAQHPETGFWTEWIEGGTVTAGISGTGTINFNLK